MKETRVSVRYAKSLLDLALEKGQLEQVREDMQLVESVVRESHDMQLLLKSPVVKSDKKQEIFKAIFGGKIGVISSQFIDITIRHRREDQLEAIISSFFDQYKSHKQILTAVITTARGLDDKLRNEVLGVVKGASKSEVELEEKVNADLIGGFVLRVGDRQVDASILRQIRNLDRKFLENPSIKES